MMSSHDIPRTDAKKRIALILLGGVVGVAVGLAGVYGIGRLTGNAGADPACQASVETARRMAPLVRGDERPAATPPPLKGAKILLYSGNYGVAHDIETVVGGLIGHHREGAGAFGLWLNATVPG